MPLGDFQQVGCEGGLRAAQLMDRQSKLHRVPPTGTESCSETSAAEPPRVGGTSASTGRDAVLVGAGAGWLSPVAIRLTAAAAVLNSGCLDTGSQSVMVYSFAAQLRSWASSAGRSQYP